MASSANPSPCDLPANTHGLHATLNKTISKTNKQSKQWVRGQTGPTPEQIAAQKLLIEQKEAELQKRREELAKKKQEKQEELAKKKEEVAKKKEAKTWKRVDDTAERLKKKEQERAALVERIKMEQARISAEQTAAAERKRAAEEAEEAKRKARASSLVKGFVEAGATDTAAERLQRWERLAAEQKDATAKEEAAVEVRRILATNEAHAVLGLGKLEAAEMSLVKRNYRLLARAVHPDKCNHPQAKEAFQKVNKAYETLRSQN
ncbi:hypothetical protein PPROV_000362000 [Pycnococcus provasolii]|uniref:J domain-containing protein n=2 Tax=Pycnococcus provasolii TaxID=41880 RepID=A0A830HDP5_9CHLO|nr:hypothetical protein PPROV_000362000 [Pycnococcus provasolii]|mmetsp:Transcript_16734/g.42858  ORF Transcript_16734/g.42858 Transcript_16734/m.42858 type:complete len:263 (+) Transcript_16734:69-857(+)